jgi:hypothetical protein
VNANRRPWVGVMLLTGAAYCVVGVVFAVLAARGASEQWRALWRLLAWAVSLVVFAAHIGHEHFRFGHRPLATAWHAAAAVGLGAFGLALAAGAHALWTGAGPRRLFALALVTWPVVMAVPAFVVALLAAVGLGLLRREVRPSEGRQE